MSTDATQLEHFQNYPMCGFCTQAWDVVYGRMRSTLSPDRWASMCPWNGCDPMIWDYFTDETGWPPNWDIDGHGVPLAYKEPTRFKLEIPDYDNRVFHMRKDSSPAAPWRNVNQRLIRESQKANEKDKESRRLENIFEDEDEVIEVPEEVAAALAAELEDEELWG